MTDNEILIDLRKRAKAERGKAHEAARFAAYYKISQDERITLRYLAEAETANTYAAFFKRVADIVEAHIKQQKEMSK